MIELERRGTGLQCLFVGKTKWQTLELDVCHKKSYEVMISDSKVSVTHVYKKLPITEVE